METKSLVDPTEVKTGVAEALTEQFLLNVSSQGPAKAKLTRPTSNLDTEGVDMKSGVGATCIESANHSSSGIKKENPVDDPENERSETDIASEITESGSEAEFGDPKVSSVSFCNPSTIQSGSAVNVKAGDINNEAAQSGSAVNVKADDINNEASHSGSAVNVKADDINNEASQSGSAVNVKADDIDNEASQSCIPDRAQSAYSSDDSNRDIEYKPTSDDSDISIDSTIQGEFTRDDFSEEGGSDDQTQDTDSSNSGKNASFKCTFCRKTFPQDHLLKSHMSTAHNYKCMFCTKAFIRNSNYKKHLLTHKTESVKQNPKQNRHKCKKCKAGFPSDRQLLEHKVKHGKSRKYKCTQCEKSFTCESILERHVNSHKLHTCEICGEEFTKNKNLKRHQNIHFNKSKYKCEWCDLTFTRVDAYKLHVMRLHTAAKTLHICEICDKTFARGIDLGRHRSVHKSVDEKAATYQCDICKQTFFVI